MHLLDVTFGKVEKIGDNAFNHCLGLTQINLDNTEVAEIGEAAFASCENLEKATLPVTLKTLQARAFNACFRLGNITIKAIEVPTMVRESALISGSSIRRNIYVPSGSVQAYKNANNWKIYANEISAILEI